MNRIRGQNKIVKCEKHKKDSNHRDTFNSKLNLKKQGELANENEIVIIILISKFFQTKLHQFKYTEKQKFIRIKMLK